MLNMFYEFDWEWPEFQGDVNQRLKAFQERCEKNMFFPSYGSCDSIEQFFKSDINSVIETLPEKYIVIFEYLEKEKYAGYRFHKNGPYIGDKQISECLGDCDELDGIFRFHIYRAKQ